VKDIYKNPIFYYVLAPVIAALWPLLVWTVYLPSAEHNWQLEKVQYSKAQKIIAEILTYDPDRLEFAVSSTDEAEFDYANVVEKVANLCRIPSKDYKLSSGLIMTSGDKKTQDARVTLNEVSIVEFAKFLSTIQLRWASLECVQVKLTKNKAMPDVWKADLNFKYYY